MSAPNSTFPTSLTWWKSWFSGLARSSPQPERRVAGRLRMRFEAEVEGPDDAVLIPVKGIDINEYGAMVVSRQPWAPGSRVLLQLKSVRLAGSAVVRHCTLLKEGRYAIGLEFYGPLKRHHAETWHIQQFGHATGAWTERDDVVPPMDEAPSW